MARWHNPQPDGSFKGYNTDWVAAIEAIERKLYSSSAGSSSGQSPLAGRTVVVIGAGGAGRALAFGAVSKWVYEARVCRVVGGQAWCGGIQA